MYLGPDLWSFESPFLHIGAVHGVSVLMDKFVGDSAIAGVAEGHADVYGISAEVVERWGCG